MKKHSIIYSKFLGWLLVLLFSTTNLLAQKVAVALSGGGADGLTHIGVLKALEKNHIPIDYIAGTSMGALIGGLYASGYSPEEIEKFALSDKFQTWAIGDIEETFIYYFKKKSADASWITYKFSLDTNFRASIPTNLVDPIPIDFGLLELFSNASAASKHNFDSLMIPFRCVASDITTKQQTIFDKGQIGQCIRASMSYPFYLKPITIDGKLFFDGGLYNNFPIDVAYKIFKPDVIIGSTVSENVQNPNEDDIISQVKSMMMNRSMNNETPPNTIIISPNITNVSLFDFSKVSKLIEIGYQATEEKMNEISTLVARRSNPDTISCIRQKFVQKENRLVFDNIEIKGLKKGQQKYVRGLLQPKGKLVTLEELKPLYYRLVADEKIKQIYPLATFNPKTGYYKLSLNVKKQKEIFASFGGNFSSRPINEAYIGLQYNYLNRIGTSFFANSYFGKLYGSYQFRTRLDFPTQLPFNLDISYTRNRFDFFKSSVAFFEDVKPSYLIQYENFADAALSFPSKNKSKIVVGVSNIARHDDYYQDKSFTSLDTADRTIFNANTAYVYFERNTLNKKQYPNSGTYFGIKGRAVEGYEFNYPGSTSEKKDTSSKYHFWYQFKLTYDSYYKRRGALRLGFFTETVVSSQDFFNNHTASLLAAPVFAPLPESKTRFLPNFRTNVYTSIGLKNVLNFYKNFDIRIEGYIFQPYNEILLSETDKTANYGPAFGKRYFIASTGLVYHSPIGPLSLCLNYFDRDEFNSKSGIYSVLFSFGYIMFNKRALE